MRRQLDALCAEQGIARSIKIEVSLSSSCVSMVACGAGVAVIDRLSAWMGRDLPIEIREFVPHLKSELSIYRPWGVIASTIADTFTEHLVQTTKSYMAAMDESISRMAASD